MCKIYEEPCEKCGGIVYEYIDGVIVCLNCGGVIICPFLD